MEVVKLELDSEAWIAFELRLELYMLVDREDLEFSPLSFDMHFFGIIMVADYLVSHNIY